MKSKICFGIFLLSFFFSIFLVREKNEQQEKIEHLKQEMLILKNNKKNLEKEQAIQKIKERQVDLNIHRDLLMNQTLKLRKDIAIFTEEIQEIEG